MLKFPILERAVHAMNNICPIFKARDRFITQNITDEKMKSGLEI